MSRHNRRVKHFSRKPTARKALLRGLMISLVEHGRIKTTIDKAKELRRHIEKAVTIGKAGDLAARRLLLSRIANQDAVSTLLSDISPRMASRPGGYTRIIKIGRRPGDQSEMAFIEFVDYDYEAKAGKTAKPAATEGKKAKKGSKADHTASDAKIPKKKVNTKKTGRTLVAAKKRSAKKIQKASRTASRA